MMMYIHWLAALVLALFFAVVPVLAKDSMKSTALACHNIHRQNAGLKNLTWDDSLATMAQKWSQKLGKDHGCNSQNGNPEAQKQKLGENVYSSKKPKNTVELARRACEKWYKQLTNYQYSEKNYEKCEKKGSIDYMTQMMWASSKKVGCGAQECSNGYWAYTCNYSPSGNVVGAQMFPAKNFLNLCSTEKGNWSTCDNALDKKCTQAAKSGNDGKNGDYRAVIGRYVIVMSLFGYFTIHRVFLHSLA